jgi:hypothetical protein
MLNTLAILLRAAIVAAVAAALAPVAAAPRVSGSPGPDCVASCPARCSSISCSGLNVSQCDRLRMGCRRSCETRCR